MAEAKRLSQLIVVGEHDTANPFRELVIRRLMAAGWVSASGVDDKKGFLMIDWTPLGLEKAREVRRLLTELQFVEGRTEIIPHREIVILIELLGGCVAAFGLESSPNPEGL